MTSDSLRIEFREDRMYSVLSIIYTEMYNTPDYKEP